MSAKKSLFLLCTMSKTALGTQHKPLEVGGWGNQGQSQKTTFTQPTLLTYPPDKLGVGGCALVLAPNSLPTEVPCPVHLDPCPLHPKPHL